MGLQKRCRAASTTDTRGPNHMITLTLAVAATIVFLGCDPKSKMETENGLPKALPHRYDESLVLDKGLENTWYWRPLPDSLCLEGYDGVRYIARLKGMPMRKDGPGYLLYSANCEMVGGEWDAASALQSGGGIQDCDVVWDIFWKLEQNSPKGDFEFKERFMWIEERKDSTTVSNRSVIKNKSMHLPEGCSLRPGGDSRWGRSK
jgi:hypothetical protein